MKQRGRFNSPGRAFQRRRAPLPADPGKMSRDEKRRLLAKIGRLNPADAFDASGAFDLERVRQMPGAAIQQIVVHETTRTNAKGETTVQRRITLKLVDRTRAMRLDDELEAREEADQPELVSEEEKRHEETVAKMAKNDVHFSWTAPAGFPHASPFLGDDDPQGDDDPFSARGPDG